MGAAYSTKLSGASPGLVAGRFRQFNPLISCRQRRLQGVSKKERLTGRFPEARFRGRTPPKPLDHSSR